MIDPNKTIIDIENLTRRFGSKTALDEVSLRVPQGSVFGLVGENGVGKTTLIKHILGLFKPQRGYVQVFGRNPVLNPQAVLSRIGYLSEYRDLPNWMRVGELMRFTKAFYPDWDSAYAEELRQAFGLDPSMRIKNLSCGKRAQAGLLIAVAHRPDLLILDEPSTGLDPVVRQDILGAIIQTVSEEGRTVLFSSHLLDEVERVSDYVTMIHQGKIVMSAPIDDIKASHHGLTVYFHEEPAISPSFPDVVLTSQGSGREWSLVCQGTLDEVTQRVGSNGASIVDRRSLTLEEIFVAHVKTGRMN